MSQSQCFNIIVKNLFPACRHLLCPIPSCNDIFADKDLLTKHLETDHTKIDPSHQQAPVKRVIAGKYNCYFEGCNDYFDDADVRKVFLHFIFGNDIQSPPLNLPTET